MVKPFQDLDSPTDWFDSIYTDAEGDYKAVFWADLEANPYLFRMVEHYKLGVYYPEFNDGLYYSKLMTVFSYPEFELTKKIMMHSRINETLFQNKTGFRSIKGGAVLCKKALLAWLKSNKNSDSS